MEEDLVFGSFAPDGELAISILLRILKTQSPIYQSKKLQANLSNIEATMRTYSD